MTQEYQKNAQTRAKRTISGIINEVKNIKKNRIDKEVHEIRSKKTINILNKNLKPSSKDWLKRHINDRFVSQAKKDGYISRAAYKLTEINQKFKIFNTQSTNIIDLGASPGSWSEVVLRNFHHKTNLVMVDLLDMKNELEQKNNVFFIKGDFTENAIQSKIMEKFNNQKIHLILSDIAPNISGINAIDSLKMIDILDNIIDFTENNLAKYGNLVFKGFHESVSSELMRKLKKMFTKVKIFKPEASRQSSSEIYVVCIHRL